MTGRRPDKTTHASLLRGLSLASLVAVTGLLMMAGCKRAGKVEPAPQNALDVQVSPRALAEALKARGGAEVTASARFRVAPKKPDGLLGAQDITTTTNLAIDKQGHYSLREENDHDGGRWVFFTGSEIGVKLRYGKLIKRTVRGSEPQDILEQALGQPWAAWSLFSERASYTESAGADGLKALTLSLGTVGADTSERVANQGLSSWRNTAVPTQLEGKLTFLPASGQLPLTLVSADITGSFSATTTTGGVAHEVQGTVTIMFKTKALGQAVAQPMPADAEVAFTKQRTVLEERALLNDGPAAKGTTTPSGLVE